MKFIKQKYPTKRTLNFVASRKKGAGVALQLAYFFGYLLILALFVNFAILGRYRQVDEAKNKYYSMQAMIQDLKNTTKDYNDVYTEYRYFTNEFLSEEESNEQDRMDVLALAEECVQDRADIKSIDIASNELTITLNNTTLSDVSLIVADLENNYKTSYVTVTTAGTEKDLDLVSAYIVVHLKSGGEL